MAFKIHKVDGGYVLPWEYNPVGAITPKIGMGLAASAGVWGASAKPTHICMAEYGSAVASGTVVPMVRVDGAEWESELAAANSALKIGALVDISATGLTVASTTTANKNFEITYVNGTASGDMVRGRFREPAAAAASGV